MTHSGIRLLAFLFLMLALWQFLDFLKLWPEYIFPTPLAVLDAFMKGIADQTFVSAILASMKRMAIGFGIALTIGLVLGMMISQSRLAEETIGQLVLGVQALPSICWLPLAVLWFGLNEKAIIFVVVIGAIGSITMAISSGITNVPPIYINAARTMGAKGFTLYKEVIFPAALPAMVAGVRQGWSFAWRSLMAGELIFFTIGLGQLLQVGRELNDINQIAAVMILIMSIGLIVEKVIFGKVEETVRIKWGLTKDR